MRGLDEANKFYVQMRGSGVPGEKFREGSNFGKEFQKVPKLAQMKFMNYFVPLFPPSHHRNTWISQVCPQNKDKNLILSTDGF
jgi:hypothetical protein